MKKKVLIFGNSLHAKACKDLLDQNKYFNFAGYIEKNKTSKYNDNNIHNINKKKFSFFI